MKVWSFTNNKGGVGKSTSSVNVASYFALKGKKVLLIDLDPQGNSTYNLIVDKLNVERTMLEVFDDNDIKSAIIKTDVENLYIIPANLNLDLANMNLMNRYRREDLLKDLLVKIEDDFDICVIDTSPALNVLTFNALVASTSIYIPVRAGGYELQGMRNLISVIKSIHKDNVKPQIFFTQFQAKQNLSKIIKEEIESEFGKTMKSSIRQNVALSESLILTKPIFLHDDTSNGAKDYETLCKEIAKIEKIKL